MQHMRIAAQYTFADTTVRYLADDRGQIGLLLFPSARRDTLAERRRDLSDDPAIEVLPDDQKPASAAVVDPLVHVKLVGDPYPGAFAQGHTLRSSPSNERFRYEDQHVETNGDRTTIRTRLASEDGLRIEHRLGWHASDAAVSATSIVTNASDHPVRLELLTSFSLGGLTPFAPDDAPRRLRVHRFRSAWSNEGRLETRSIEELHVERSWSGASLVSERFGQIGSMPVRKWFPFVALEDTEAGVTWAAQLAWAGSWQMEVSRQHDDVCLSGGLGDRELGHWTKSLAPGESLESPPAFLACAAGGLDEVCDRLTALQHRPADAQPTVEADLPIIFNDWCTTWGDPQHEKVVAIADRLAGSDVRYHVVDAGWYKQGTADWGNGHGDWMPSADLFPHGLKGTADAIRERGLIPGLWFEMETVGDASDAFGMVDHLLKRDGLPVTVRHRRFWDLNDPVAVDYLTDRVIGLLDRCGFGYLKVDYNETLGLGCDHADGLGEGLRRQTLATYRFFERIRERLPELVIENCSSGGHRLEPSMIGRTAMSSFSDAHETREIPIIAANLHRLMLPRQSQIWAVLHASDSDRRLIYSLAATFLGRMCLSGEIADLSTDQWAIVRRAMGLYRKAAPTIKHGTSRRFGPTLDSWRHARGWQAVRRVATEGNTMLVVGHAFADAPSRVDVPLNQAGWRVVEVLKSGGDVGINNGQLRWTDMPDWSAFVALLSRAPQQGDKTKPLEPLA